MFDLVPYFCDYRNMALPLDQERTTELTANSTQEPDVARYADMFSAMGTEPRLRIMRLLLAAHPHGMIAGDIGTELDIPASTLSHHLDKLKNEDLVIVRRESTFLWYSANAEALRELLGFLYAECCTRNKAIEPQAVISIESGNCC
jgi:ArsR family transcriptional regulator, arsenate/arsenite/antimonite-responsive transcriptional repressor